MVGDKARVIVVANRQKELLHSLFLELQRQLQGRRVTGGAIILDERPDHARFTVQRSLHRLKGQTQRLETGHIPAGLDAPNVVDLGNIGLGQGAGLVVAAILHQGVQGVHALAQVVRRKDHHRASLHQAI